MLYLCDLACLCVVFTDETRGIFSQIPFSVNMQGRFPAFDPRQRGIDG